MAPIPNSFGMFPGQNQLYTSTVQLNEIPTYDLAWNGVDEYFLRDKRCHPDPVATSLNMDPDFTGSKS
jgi:hypothetical protein